MKRIFKYPVPVTASVCIDLPKGAEVLTVQNQGSSLSLARVGAAQPQIWALVDDAAPSEPRTFRWFGTGYALPEPLGTYVGTIQLGDGALVFHLFEAP